MLATTVFALAATITSQNRGNPLTPGPTGPSDYTKKHALLIGIDTYSNLKGDSLNYAAADAKEVASVLQGAYGFQDVQVVAPEETTLPRLRRILTDFTSPSRISAGDIAILFIACHSEVDEASKGYFLVSDTMPSGSPGSSMPVVLTSTCLPMSEVRDAMKSCKARHTLVIADSCFSGVLMTERSPAGRLATRGLDPSQIRSFLEGDAKRLFSASDTNQTAREDPVLRHGVLTAMLLRELYVRSQEVGRSFDLTDLFVSVRREVMTYTHSMQRPRIAAADSAYDLVFKPTAALPLPDWLVNAPDLRPEVDAQVIPLPEDVPESHWCASSVKLLAQAGLQFVYPDNRLRGSRPASRYEMAVSVASVLRATESLKPADRGPLPDDVPPDHWAADALSQLGSDERMPVDSSGEAIWPDSYPLIRHGSGYLLLYPDGKYRGARPCSRLEFAMLVASIAQQFMTAEERSAPPAKDQSHWSESMLKALGELERARLLDHYPDGIFRGSRPLSRYEMIAMMASLYTFLKTHAH